MLPVSSSAGLSAPGKQNLAKLDVTHDRPCCVLVLQMLTTYSGDDLSFVPWHTSSNKNSRVFFVIPALLQKGTGRTVFSPEGCSFPPTQAHPDSFWLVCSLGG